MSDERKVDKMAQSKESLAERLRRQRERKQAQMDRINKQMKSSTVGSK